MDEDEFVRHTWRHHESRIAVEQEGIRELNECFRAAQMARASSSTEDVMVTKLTLKVGMADDNYDPSDEDGETFLVGDWYYLEFNADHLPAFAYVLDELEGWG